MVEIWKDIPEFKGAFQASSYGRIRSLDGIIVRKNGTPFTKKGKIFNPTKTATNGYYMVNIRFNGKSNVRTVHSLVASAFGKTGGQTIDHIDGNKLNNKPSNLESVSYRENNSRMHERIGGTSKYRGVSISPSGKKWLSFISVSGKSINLGSFDSEELAHEAYNKAIKSLIH